MKLLRFAGHYMRRHMPWLALAAIGSAGLAVTTVVTLSLVEPIFSEVLLTERGDAPAFGFGLGAPEAVAEEPAPAAAAAGEPVGARERLLRLGRRINLRAFLLGQYTRLKAFFGVDADSVVFFLPGLVFFVYVVRSLMSFLASYSFQRVGLAATNDLRNDLYSNILRQSSRFYAKHPSGELISRIVNDIAVMQNAITTRVVDLVTQPLTLVLMIYFLLSIHLQLAIVCLVAAPLMLFPIVRFGQGMRRTSHRSQERMADLAGLVAEGVRGQRIVKAFGMESFEDERFQRATGRHLRVNLWAQMLSAMSSPIVESLAVFGAAVLLVYAGRQIRAGELTAALLVAFLGNLFWMYDPIRRLNKVNLILQQAMAAVHRVYRLMQAENEIVESPNAVTLPGIGNGIEFRAISFGYSGEGVLHGVDLEIEAGEVVALVGPSGAGKTTLVNLLPRFFDPDEGQVLIDGVDIREVTLESLRSLIGLVTQETVLFDDTVRANLAYGRSDLSLERIREAAAAAYADEFIMELPQGYDTEIGENGFNLSGGQRQRLAIARALLKNAPLLILDEATSHLDTQSEALVQKALDNLMRDRTTLVIAHRLSTVMQCDRIVVMESGRILEQGAHAELMGREGLYKRLYDLQFRA